MLTHTVNEARATKHVTRRLMQWLLAALVAFAALAAFPLLILSVFYKFTDVALLEPDYAWTQVYSIPSPDSHSFLLVTKRIAYPANELVDPSIDVVVALHRGRHVLGRQQLTLAEDSDLQEPRIEWAPDVVRVRDLDSRLERTLTFNRNASPLIE